MSYTPAAPRRATSPTRAPARGSGDQGRWRQGEPATSGRPGLSALLPPPALSRPLSVARRGAPGAARAGGGRELCTRPVWGGEEGGASGVDFEPWVGRGGKVPPEPQASFHAPREGIASFSRSVTQTGTSPRPTHPSCQGRGIPLALGAAPRVRGSARGPRGRCRGRAMSLRARGPELGQPSPRPARGVDRAGTEAAPRRELHPGPGSAPPPGPGSEPWGPAGAHRPLGAGRGAEAAPPAPAEASPPAAGPGKRLFVPPSQPRVAPLSFSHPTGITREAPRGSEYYFQAIIKASCTTQQADRCAFSTSTASTGGPRRGDTGRELGAAMRCWKGISRVVQSSGGFLINSQGKKREAPAHRSL